MTIHVDYACRKNCWNLIDSYAFNDWQEGLEDIQRKNQKEAIKASR